MTLVILAFFGLVASVTSISIYSLRSMEEKVQDIQKFGLVETRFFAELSDHLPELRLTEMSVVHAEGVTERAAILVALAQHRATLGEAAAKIDSIPPGRIDEGLRQAFRAAWKRYADLHDDHFSAGDPLGAWSISSPLHKAFVATEDALDQLIGDSQIRIAREVEEANALSLRVMTAMVASAVIATVAALVLYLMARHTIFAPLRQITEALTGLARGRTNIEIPRCGAHDEISRLAEAFIVFRANLAELKHANGAAKIARRAAEVMAHRDPLTNLPNRRALAARLPTFFDADEASSAVCALLLVDLDRFKPVNDLLGHMIGDLVLCAVARRLEEACPRSGLVARIGGDEFAVVAPLADSANVQPAQDLARRIVESLRAPFLIGDHRIEIGASIGIALSTWASDPVGLLSAADIAMYRAKKSGGAPISLFEAEMEGELRRRVGLEKALRQALAAGEITPHYQPIVDLVTRKLCGFELLARWRDVELGEVSPEVFIPLAEQQGLIQDLTAAMLAQACRDAALWPEDVRLSLNVSPVQLRDAGFPEILLESLRKHGFSPRRLEIEITETALIGDVQLVRDSLVRLRSAGVKVSLDDFGMGFSSLNHLRHFKIDKVKIDKSFTRTVLDDPESALIVRSVIHLARGLHLRVVAEGIEDERTAEMMRLNGCDFGQGYHFGRAVCGAEAVALAGRRVVVPGAAA